MELVNKTKHNTKGMRKMFYALAKQAHISTNGVRVEIRPARTRCHGLCYPSAKEIIIWVFSDSKSDMLSFLFLHELKHTTSANIRLARSRSKELDADSTATMVLDLSEYDLTWRKDTWKTLRGLTAFTKQNALNVIKRYKDAYRNYRWRIVKRKEPGITRHIYKIQYK